jgi:hypothetical protein
MKIFVKVVILTCLLCGMAFPQKRRSTKEEIEAQIRKLEQNKARSYNEEIEQNKRGGWKESAEPYMMKQEEEQETTSEVLKQEYENESINSTNTLPNDIGDGGNGIRLLDSIQVKKALALDTTPNSGYDFDILQNVKGGITITGYRGDRKKVVIPATISKIKITEIGKKAFHQKRLESVVIPAFVTTIGDDAFNENSLTSVTIPNSVLSIGNKAFCYNKLTSITIPNSVKTIGYEAFSSNTLTTVKFGGSIETIGYRAFENNSIESVTIPNTVLEIGSAAFRGNSLTSVTFGNRVAVIGSEAFAYNKLTELTNLPASVKEIGMGAFRNNSISKLVLPNNRDLIFAGGNFGEVPAFTDNPITTLVIPAVLAKTTTGSAHGWFTASIGGALGNSSKTLASISMPANAPLDAKSHLISNLPNNFAMFYESQNRKAGTYNWDGRLWSVR